MFTDELQRRFRAFFIDFAPVVSLVDALEDDLLRQKLGDDGVVHLTLTAGYYLLVSRFFQTMRL